MDTREFLIRWLMEFGTEQVSWEERYANEWYLIISESVGGPRFVPYLTRTDGGVVQLNQKGLDFIKGE